MARSGTSTQRLVVAGFAGALVLSMTAFAQGAPETAATDFVTAYRNSRVGAIAVFNRYAGGLFRALALVEMAWVSVLLVLERSDLQGFTAGMLRKLLVLFAFLYLLQNGAGFADAIMNSFITIGSESAGLAVAPSPGDIVFRGGAIAENMVSKAGLTGFLTNPAPTLVICIAAVIVCVAFCIIAIHYVMALIESYIVVSAGLIFLGFGGSSVTRPYVERFFALAVAVGVKLMVLYMVVGIGMNLSDTWAAVADGIATSANPFRDTFDMVMGSLIFAAIAWGVPKFAGSLLAGSPAFTGGDILSTGMAAVNAALLAGGTAALATRGVAAMAGAGTSALSSAANAGGREEGGGTSGGGGGSSGGGPGVSGGSGGGDSGGSYSPKQPPPPSEPAPTVRHSGGAAPPTGGTATASTHSVTAPAAGGETSMAGSLSSGESSGSGSVAPAAPQSATAASPQVQPPGWAKAANKAHEAAKAAEGAAEMAQKGVQRAAVLAFLASRMIPPEGGGGAAPTHLRMDGD